MKKFTTGTKGSTPRRFIVRLEVTGFRQRTFVVAVYGAHGGGAALVAALNEAKGVRGYKVHAHNTPEADYTQAHARLIDCCINVDGTPYGEPGEPNSPHTSGPWTLAEYEGEPNRLVIGPNNELIADCSAPTHEDYELPEDYQANAKAIAALPDLLAALEHFDDLFTGRSDEVHDDDGNTSHEMNGLIEQVRAAIVKAKGP